MTSHAQNSPASPQMQGAIEPSPRGIFSTLATTISSHITSLMGEERKENLRSENFPPPKAVSPIDSKHKGDEADVQAPQDGANSDVVCALENDVRSLEVLLSEANGNLDLKEEKLEEAAARMRQKEFQWAEEREAFKQKEEEAAEDQRVSEARKLRI